MPSDRRYRSGLREPGFVDPNRGFKRRPLVETARTPAAGSRARTTGGGSPSRARGRRTRTGADGAVKPPHLDAAHVRSRQRTLANAPITIARSGSVRRP